MKAIFFSLALITVAYTIFCFINIILSWIPGAKFTGFGKFVTAITDPYLNLFRKISWLHTNSLDFSPILSIGLLSLLSSVFSTIVRTDEGTVFGPALSSIFQSSWGIVSSLLGFLFILILVRFIVLCVQGGRTDYNSIWAQLDNFLGRLATTIAKPFYKNLNNYKICLLISLIVILIINVSGAFLFRWIETLCFYIPF